MLPRLIWIAFITLTLSACGSAGGDNPTDTGSADTNPTCTDGQSRVDGVCVDINECDEGSHNCAENSVCTNTDGGFACECKSGYQGDGLSCTDVDECLAGTDTCGTLPCVNTVGSFTCECASGYSWDGSSCVDIDECACTEAQASLACAGPSRQHRWRRSPMAWWWVQR